MPIEGECLTAEFKRPDVESDKGIKRSLFLQSSGYYMIHLDVSAEPQEELLAYLENTPGAAVEISMNEYRNWLTAVHRTLNAP